MSRIGKLPIALPSGVTVEVSSDNVIKVKGKLGELTQELHPKIKAEVLDNQVLVSKLDESKLSSSLHGLSRSLINNMVVGVSTGFKSEQELVGVGYRAVVNQNNLELSLGYSHNIVFQLPKEVVATAEQAKGKPPVVTLVSADKQLLGMINSKLRSLRKPEPYKGKGIKFVGEVLRRKAGKSAGK
jgi:large subunit ribosomal protein L6